LELRTNLLFFLLHEEYLLGLWELLYQDPLIELQILAIRSEESETPSSELKEMLDRAGIEEFFNQAQTIIVNESDYQEAIESAKEPLGEYRIAIARALVAQSSLLVKNKRKISSRNNSSR